MNNFFKEHEGYLKLNELLLQVNLDLAQDLTDIVHDAIQYGISKLHEKLQENHDEHR